MGVGREHLIWANSSNLEIERENFGRSVWVRGANITSSLEFKLDLPIDYPISTCN